MMEEETIDLKKLIDALMTLHNITGSHFDNSENIPSENSRASQEIEQHKNPGLMRAVFSQGNMLIEVAADQLIAFTRSISEPILTISPWTCVRAIIESGAIAAWLLDPTIDNETRIQRSFSFRYEGLNQQAKYGRSTDGKLQIKEVLTRINELENRALELGYEKVINKNGKRIGIAMQMPPTTQLVKENLNQESAYRLLSSIAHGHHWALQKISFRKIEKDGALFLDKNIDPMSIWYLCNIAAKSFVKPVWFFNKLLGWEALPLINLFNYVFDTLGMAQSERVWID